MPILLTGGYGCIGSWIIKNLAERGETAWVYDLMEEHKRLNQVMDRKLFDHIRHISGDVSDPGAFKAAVEKHGITHVIHLAGLQVPVCKADPMRGARVNVLGTLAVFEAAKALPGQVKRIVYASSAAVFGPSEDDDSATLADSASPTPATHYGVFKAANEGNARIYFEENGISSVGLRPASVYGVGRDFGMTSEPTKALKSVAIDRPYKVSFGGWQDLQFADDVAKTFLACAERNPDYRGYRVFNLHGHKVDLPTIHQTMCELKPSAKTLISYGTKQLPIAYSFSDEGMQKTFGPIPLTPLKDGFAQTLKRFRQLSEEGRLDLSDLG
jgi:nucleoside-diphosphate-sugar epimerase